MNNNNQYGYQQQQPGFQYNNQRPTPNLTQPLTAEEIKRLRGRGASFSLQIEPDEMLRAICTHKDQSGITLRGNNDGSSTCSICGETFTLAQMDESAVAEAVLLVTDILQTVKTYYLDIGEQVAREYFPIIPLLKKLPQLYKISLDRFDTYDRGMNVQQSGNMYGFGMLNNIMGGGYPQQPQFNQQQQFNQQPQFNQQQPQFQQFNQQQQFQPQDQFNNQQNPFCQPQQQFNNQPQFQQQPQFNNQVQQQAPVQQQAQQPAPVASKAPVQQNNAPVVNTRAFNI